ncbi:MAG TPA: FRG domain-containing protein [Candidatus Angelobacter sp.]
MALNETNETLDWETFEQRLKKLRVDYGPSEMLFRGQSNSEWQLTTTLERNWAGRVRFVDYTRLICANIGPAVKTFADVEVPEYSPSTDVMFDRELLSLSKYPPDPLYRYMVHLRHFGFPSPLLDWSRSPFVAAFFAFKDDLPNGAEKRSIYVYSKMRGALGERTIHQIGPYVQTHERHFRQQCDYTLCGRRDETYGWCFESHQGVVDDLRPGQDYLGKFDLLSSEREKVLRLLNDYNLNAFSLFGSQESLLETMWFREYVLKKDTWRG